MGAAEVSMLVGRQRARRAVGVGEHVRRAAVRRDRAQGRRMVAVVAAAVAMSVVVGKASLSAHHSFAMYDQTATKTMTGKLTRFVPGGNHAQLIFEVLDDDGKAVLDTNGKPLLWGVETGGAAAIARAGVTVASFPQGTVFAVTLYPLRDGRHFGAVAGPLIKCGSAVPKGGCNKDTGQVLTPPAN
jgi:hypothetical protein